MLSIKNTSFSLTARAAANQIVHSAPVLALFINPYPQFPCMPAIQAHLLQQEAQFFLAILTVLLNQDALLNMRLG